MAEYIEREALCTELNTLIEEYLDEHTFATDFAAGVVCEIRDNVISAIPAADVVERKRGEWVEVKVKNFYGCMITAYECTNCKKHSIGQVAITMKSDFCPNCGAKVDGE